MKKEQPRTSPNWPQTPNHRFKAIWTINRIIDTTETILSTSWYKLLKWGETLKSSRVVPSKEQLPLLNGKYKSEENWIKYFKSWEKIMPYLNSIPSKNTLQKRRWNKDISEQIQIKGIYHQNCTKGNNNERSSSSKQRIIPDRRNDIR